MQGPPTLQRRDGGPTAIWLTQARGIVMFRFPAIRREPRVGSVIKKRRKKMRKHKKKKLLKRQRHKKR